MTIVATDGYEYEDLTQRLLGRPLENSRNYHIKEHARYFYRNDPQALKIFVEGYDHWKIKLSPFYWLEGSVERSWQRVAQGKAAVIEFWASQPRSPG